MLVAKNIYKSFADLKVLSDVSLTVEKGELVSIVGASGAGKSTLLHILGSLDKPDKGMVHLGDTDIFKLSQKKLAAFRNQQIGFIFQFHYLLPEFSALENVSMPGFIAKRDEKEVKKKATELLELLGLKDRLDHKPSEMSGGEQQRVAVARALVNDPAIIFADEPTGNLDSQNAKEMHELFLSLSRELNQTFVIVTHNEELAKMSDRQVKMLDGEIQL